MTNAIESHITNRIWFVLSRFSDVVKKVEVYVSDENGPKGGIDKSCLLRITTGNRTDLIIKDRQDDLYIVVTRALSRAKQSLSRHIRKTRLFNRKRVTNSLLLPEEDKRLKDDQHKYHQSELEDFTQAEYLYFTDKTDKVL
jgi:hypothetical protein